MVHVTCDGVEPGKHVDEASAQNLLLVEPWPPWPWPTRANMHLDTELEAVRHYLATLLLVKPRSVPAHLSQHGLATSRHYVTFPSARLGFIRRHARDYCKRWVGGREQPEIRPAAASGAAYSRSGVDTVITFYSFLVDMKLLGRSFAYFSLLPAERRPNPKPYTLNPKTLNPKPLNP